MPRLFCFPMMLAVFGAACSSEPPREPELTPDASDYPADCRGEGEPIDVGFEKAGDAGFNFALLKLVPAVPLQTSKKPGNVWSVAIEDASGARARGTLLVSASMPLHNNHPVSTPIAIDAGLGLYDIEDLLLPMPGLYSISLLFTSETGARDNVVLALCMSTKSG